MIIKQTLLEVLLLIVLLLVIGIGFVVGMQAFSDINDDIQADLNIDSMAKAESNSVVTSFPTWADNAVFMIMVFFWILMLVSSFLIDTHPVFFIVTFILLIFVFVISMIISNTYQDIVGDAGLTTFSLLFPKINWVMNNLLIVTIVMALSVGVALYAKQQG